MTQLPAAPDDGFLDSRSTRHKRLPHLLRDLDYVIETPGTALRLLLPLAFPVYQGPSLSFRGDDVLAFSSIFIKRLFINLIFLEVIKNFPEDFFPSSKAPMNLSRLDSFSFL